MSGATVDVFTDNTAAINTAITTAAAYPGGLKIRIASGAYGFTGQIQLQSNVIVEGDGTLTHLKYSHATSVNACLMLNNLTTGDSNITLRNFLLDRSGNNAQHGILLNGVTNLTVDGVEIVGVPSVASGALGISGVLPGGSGATLALSKDVRVTNCRFQSANNFGVQLSYVTNATVTGNIFDDCYREAVGVEPETGCIATNVTITGNAFTMGTIPSGGTATGVIVITESSGGAVQQVTVTSNVITNTLATSTDLNPGITVLVAGNKGIGLIGNQINGMNGNGITVGSASFSTIGVMIVSNTVINCNASNSGTLYTGAGISLRHASQCVLAANYINGTYHTASVYESQSGVGRNLLVGNQFADTTPYVLLAGSNTVEVLNIGHGVGSGNRVAVSAAYAMTVTDSIIAYTATASAFAVTMVAASAAPMGKIYRVVDESQGAATHNITINRAGSDTFTDGTTSKVINTNGGEVAFYSTGTAWQTV